MKRKSLSISVALFSLALTMVASLIVGCAKAPPSPTPSSPTAKPTPPTSPTPTVKPASPSPTLTRQEQLEAGSKKEGSVVIWAAFLTDADKWMVKFKERYPWLKVEAWQADVPTTTERAIAESKAGVRNVDIINVSDDIIPLIPMDLLAKYEWPNALYYPAEAKPAGGQWFALHLTVTGPTYNSKLVAGADVPKTWDDLKDPKWKGKMAASLSAAEAPLMLAALWGTGGKLDWDKSFSFWREVFKNTEPRIVNMYTGPTRLMGAGEFQIFNYSSIAATIREKAGGLPVEPVPISRLAARATGMAIIKDAPHPNAARLFADWLTSPEGATAFTEVMFYPSLNTGAGGAAANRILKEKGISPYLIPASILTPGNLKKTRDFWSELALTGVKK